MSFYLEVLTNHQVTKWEQPKSSRTVRWQCKCGETFGGATRDLPVIQRKFAQHQADEITKALRNMTGGDLEWTYEHTETSSSGVTINAAVSVPMTADVGVRASVAGQSVHDAVQLINDRIWSDE